MAKKTVYDAFIKKLAEQGEGTEQTLKKQFPIGEIIVSLNFFGVGPGVAVGTKGQPNKIKAWIYVDKQDQMQVHTSAKVELMGLGPAISGIAKKAEDPESAVEIYIDENKAKIFRALTMEPKYVALTPRQRDAFEEEYHR